MSEPGPAFPRWLVIAVGAVLVALLLGGLVAASPLPTNDGPQHVLAAWMRGHVDDVGYAWRESYVLNEPLTSRGALELIQLFAVIADSEVAFTLFLCLVVLLYGVGGVLLASSWSRARAALALLLLPWGLTWSLYIGLLPFALAQALTPWVILVGRRSGPVATAGVALLLYLQACCHPLPAAMTGFLWAATTLADQASLRSLARVAIAGAPAAFLALLVRAASTFDSGTMEHISSASTLARIPAWLAPGPAWRSVGAVVVVVVAIVVGVWRGRALSTPSRGLFCAGLALVVVLPLVPYNWSGWQMLSPRIIAAAVLAVVVAVPVEQLTHRAQRAVFVGVAVFSLASAGWSIPLHRSLREASAPAWSAFARLPERSLVGKVWSPIVSVGDLDGVDRLDGVVPSHFGLLHVGQIGQMRAGGVALWGQNRDPTIHALLYRGFFDANPLMTSSPPGSWRTTWPQDDLRLRRLNLTSIAASTAWAGTTVLYGLPEDGAVLADTGFVVDKVFDDEHGNALFVGTFVGCSVRLRVEGAPEPATIEIGIQPSLEPFDALVVRGTDDVVVFDGLPCGELWLRADVGCAGADEWGRVRYLVAADDDALLCTRLPVVP